MGVAWRRGGWRRGFICTALPKGRLEPLATHPGLPTPALALPCLACLASHRIAAHRIAPKSRGGELPFDSHTSRRGSIWSAFPLLHLFSRLSCYHTVHTLSPILIIQLIRGYPFILCSLFAVFLLSPTRVTPASIWRKVAPRPILSHTPEV